MTRYHRIVSFDAVGPLHALRIRERIAALPGVSVLHGHERRLGWLERTRLWAQERRCRLVLEIDGAPISISEQPPGVSPYRSAPDVVLVVRPDLAAIVDAVGGTTDRITGANLAFETRSYEPAVLERLHATLRGVLEQAPGEFEWNVAGDRVFGRVVGAFASVREAEETVRRSGLCEARAIRVTYR